MKIKTDAATKQTASTSAVANPYLSADGMLNFAAVAKLQDSVARQLKADKAGALKVTSTFVVRRRAKPVPYSSAVSKQKDHKYQLGRAIQVAERKRLKPESLARVAVLLQVVDGLPAAITANVKKAVTAITSHMKKMPKIKDKVTGEKAKIREANNKEFDKIIGEVTELLVDAGIKERDVVVGQTMMGKTVQVKLPSGAYIAITRSDAARMKAARASLVD